MNIFKSLVFPFLLPGIFIFTGCRDKSDLIGTFPRADLLNTYHKTWFQQEYNAYLPDTSVFSNRTELLNDVEIKVFLGTWCSDSKREVPRFLKILDTIGFDPQHLTLIGLDREKSAPDYRENEWDIEYVPTMIFLRQGIEVGRIIETPEQTLELDMFTILDQKE